MPARLRPRGVSLRMLLAGLPILAVLPLLAFSLWLLYIVWQSSNDNARRDLSQTVDTLAVAVDRELMGLTRELRLLGDFPPLDTHDMAVFYRYSQELVARKEGWDSIVAVELDGTVLMNTDKPLGSELAPINQPHVKKAIESRVPVLSNIYRDQYSGKQLISIAVPIPRGGAVRWVLEGRIDPDSLSRVIARGLGPGTTALIADGNNLAAARSRDFVSYFGKPIAQGFRTLMDSEPVNGVDSGHSADGVEVLVAWRRLQGVWTVAVFEPMAVRDVPLQRSINTLLAFGGVVLTIGLLSSLLLGKRIRQAIAQVAEDAHGLAQGEALPRRLSRITEVAAMFDSLTDAGRIQIEGNREREQTHDALKVSGERLKLALDATEAGVFDWDLIRDKVEWGERSLDLFGLPPDTPPELGALIRRIPDDERARVAAAIDAAIAGVDLGRLQLEFSVISPEKGRRWIEMRAMVHFEVIARQLRAKRLIGVFVDQTERHEGLDLLREADRRKDEFLAMLAHELRNPLAPMRNAASLLSRTLTPESTQWRAVRMLDRQVSHMTRLVNDLLDVSRISQGKIELRLEPIRLGPVVEGAVDAVRAQVDERHQSLTVNLPSPEPVVEADSVRIAQVLENLLSNASKYTPPEGLINLDVETLGDEVVIKVRDTGIGIAPGQLTNVFEMFTQIDATLDRAQGGLGIGLSLVKRLVELHGGTVAVTSEGLGHGSCFEFRLPRSDKAAVA
jgi:signal transduction histidine kinase